MKTTKEMIEVMQAHERGEKIEGKLLDSGDVSWIEISNPWWDWSKLDYRVKTKKKKKYVPFDTAEDFLAAQREHGCEVKVNSIDNSGFFARKFENNVELLAFVNADGGVAFMKNGRITHISEMLSLEANFADGTPCGKEVEV